MPLNQKNKFNNNASRKIKISSELIHRTIDFLEYLDIGEIAYDSEILQLYGYLSYTFNKKKDKIKSKGSYAQFPYDSISHGYFNTTKNAVMEVEDNLPF